MSSVAAFAERVSTVTAADLPSSYHAGCPVGPAQLRALHMSYWGFDDRPHTGTMIVNAAVVDAVLTVFGRLYAERFPIRRMEPVDAFGGSDPASMAADNTSRVQLPQRGRARTAALVGARVRRGDRREHRREPVRRGRRRATARGLGVPRSREPPARAWRTPAASSSSAFAAVGWQWGGRWSDPDYQHFSATGG